MTVLPFSSSLLRAGALGNDSPDAADDIHDQRGPAQHAASLADPDVARHGTVRRPLLGARRPVSDTGGR
jgi:hypothetical protein